MEIIHVQPIKQVEQSPYIFVYLKMVLEYNRKPYEINAVLTLHDLDNVLEDFTYTIDKRIIKEAELYADYTGYKMMELDAYIKEFIRGLM